MSLPTVPPIAIALPEPLFTVPLTATEPDASWPTDEASPSATELPLSVVAPAPNAIALSTSSYVVVVVPPLVVVVTFAAVAPEPSAKAPVPYAFES